MQIKQLLEVPPQPRRHWADGDLYCGALGDQTLTQVISQDTV